MQKNCLLLLICLLPSIIFGQKTVKDIKMPYSYVRVEVEENSFASYLRNLSLSSDNTIYAYDGRIINSGYNYAVIDIDIGNRDLQQCADAVMRLWAEYLYAQKRYSDIKFNFLADNKPHYFVDYAHGNYSYTKFRRYMNYVFAYANTMSLKRQLKHVKYSDMQIGDVFIQTGRPYGHAVIIVDMAVSRESGDTIFMVAQSFMPAQSIHVLRNVNNKRLNPWFKKNPIKKDVNFPSWKFTTEDLYRFDD